MSTIMSALNLADSQRTYVGQLGKALVFDAINQALAEHAADVAAALSVFVERTTENYTERYLLPGGGKLQELGEQSAPGAVKRSGYWDIAFPIREWGASFGGSRVGLAYMTVQELDAHLNTIMAQDLNTMRWRVLTALFEDTNLSWTDPKWGSLTIRRLANTDGTLYPPVVGSETEADDQHYVGVEYDPASIDSTHNPVPNAVSELVEHTGGQKQYGNSIVIFHNNDATAYLAALSDFVAVQEQFVVPGATTATLAGLPTNIPGRVHGRVDGAFLSEWRWIPAGYAVALDLNEPKPLIMRVDPSDTGLGSGLQLVARDAAYPLESSYYSHRFGLGCGNRLNGYVVYMDDESGGTYAPPSGYSE